MKADVEIDNSLHKLQAVNYNVTKQGEWVIQNNGHALVVSASLTESGCSSQPKIVFKRKFQPAWMGL